MTKIQCPSCLFLKDLTTFDPDHVEGPVTSFLRCPRCGHSWQGTESDFIVIKFREIAGLQLTGTLPRLPETTH